MRLSTAARLISPDTGSALRLESYELRSDRVVEGTLHDDSNGTWFRIEDEIADLSPRHLRDDQSDNDFAIRHNLSRGESNSVERDHEADGQRRFFRNHHDAYEVEVVDSPFYRVLDEETLGRWLDRALKPESLVAEIGAGSGRQTVIMSERGYNVVAVDLSVDMLRMARKRLQQRGCEKNVDFVVGIGEAPPLQAHSFDAWIIFGSLHHFSNPELAIKRCCELLVPGGKQYMLEPNNSPVRFLFDWMMRRNELWKEEANDDPLFDARQFRQWLESSGVQPIIRNSTFLPPHLFYKISRGSGEFLLRLTDGLFGRMPLLGRFGGVIIAEGQMNNPAAK